MKTFVKWICILAFAISGTCRVYAEEQMVNTEEIDNIDNSSTDFEVFKQNPKGDIDNDGIFTENDVNKMSGYMMGIDEINVSEGDMNEDDDTNILDYIMIKNNITRSNESQEIMSTDLSQSVGEGNSDFYRYMYDGKTFDVEIDADEKKIINKINEFRNRYGKGNIIINLGNYKFADEAMKIMCEEGKDDLVINFNESKYGGFLYYEKRVYWRNSSVDGVINSLLSKYTTKYLGILLEPRYAEISIGHYKNETREKWVIFCSLNYSINDETNYEIINH